MNNRDKKVDVLKFIGTLLVILAHVNPPRILFDIRTFDVVALVFASGLTLKNIGGYKDYCKYILKRFKRLVVPAWVFILIYYGLTFLIKQGQPGYFFNVNEFAKSFTLIWGLGYLWIIRVYFTLAVASPIVCKLSDLINNKKFGLILLTALLFTNEALILACDNIIKPTFVFNIIKILICYTVGYGIVEIIAKLFQKKKKYIFTYCILVFLSLWVGSGFSAPNAVKYPPQALYIFYGVCVSIIICYVCDWCKSIWSEKGLLEKVVCWVSENSLWIYFWHIFVLDFIPEEVSFLVKYCAVLVGAIGITLLQNYLRKSFERIVCR